MRASIYLFLAFALCASAQDNTNSTPKLDRSKMTSRQQLQALMFTTPAYRKEALRLIIEEANRVARELNLPEQLPITETNVLQAYISPQRMAQGLKAIGNITTSNYFYVAYSGSLFSVTRTHSEEEYRKLRTQYLWRTSRVDTNAAYQLAAQFLAAVSVDVNALNRDCRPHIIAMGKSGAFFVPAYWVYWVAKGQEGQGSVAGVELFEPTKTLWRLYVNKSEYILRKPLQIANLDSLLSQTNAPASTNDSMDPGFHITNSISGTSSTQRLP